MVKEMRERQDQRSDGGDGEWEGIGSARSNLKGEVKTSNWQVYNIYLLLCWQSGPCKNDDSS